MSRPKSCACGCGESIDHLAPQASFYDDAHRKRARRQAEAEKACERFGHSCDFGRCAVCGVFVRSRLPGTPGLGPPSPTELKTRLPGEGRFGTPDADQVAAAIERMRAARKLTKDEERWLDRVAPSSVRPMAFERESRHSQPAQKPPPQHQAIALEGDTPRPAQGVRIWRLPTPKDDLPEPYQFCTLAARAEYEAWGALEPADEAAVIHNGFRPGRRSSRRHQSADIIVLDTGDDLEAVA